ncbi:cation-translocating P-type ATPase [Mycoplasma sp. 4044]
MDSKEYFSKTDIAKGLNDAEVAKSRELFGKNSLKEAKKKHWLIVYLEQFKDLMVILLLVATVIAFALAIFEGVHTKWNWQTSLVVSFVEPFIILFVVMTNAIVGTVQEIKSQKAVESLKNMSPLMSKVIRNGILQNIKAEDIVVGDILIIESGDIVGADGLLLESTNLSCIESSLTGESTASQKDAKATRDLNLPIADQDFKVFSSSAVATGRGVVLVTEVGQQTQIGNISTLISEQENSLTPLQIKINKLGKVFGFGGIILFVVSFIMQIIFQAVGHQGFDKTSFWSSSLVNSISLAVAAIPEGLVAFTTIILSLSVRSMAKRKAIVKSLMAVETLGSTAVICSDKTGTLTQNKMTVVSYWNNQFMSENNQKDFQKTAILFALCTDANVFYENDELKEVGDPTETALLHSLKKLNNQTVDQIRSLYPRVKSFPFDSDRKLMSTINEIDNQKVIIVKGAPEQIFNALQDKSNLDELHKINEQWAKQGYRVLALGMRPLNKKEAENIDLLSEQSIENDLIFGGMVAMIDPPRESSKEAIAICKKAGIKPIMITGDNLVTSKAIAHELGIYQEGDIAVNGVQLEKMSDEELLNEIQNISVYARVAPKDKIRIVKMWQQKDQVVAMTGDGVNDAPALKASDIGCAMGITGTEVSKEAADLILVDDNFATVVEAVKNGRSIYQRIKNVIQSLLITSVAEIVLVFFGLIIFRLVFKNEINKYSSEVAGWDFFVLSATQLLWINLFTHGFPGIALGLQENNENYMNRRPYSKHESIFARGMGINTIWQGIFMGSLSVIGYWLGASWALKNGHGSEFVNAGSTVAFIILGIGATFNTLTLMSRKPIICLNPLKYWKAYSSVIFSIGFLLLVTYVSNIAEVFNLMTNFAKYSILNAYAYGLVAIIIPVYAVHKIITNLVISSRMKKHQITSFELIQKPTGFFKKGFKKE